MYQPSYNVGKAIGLYPYVHGLYMFIPPMEIFRGGCFADCYANIRCGPKKAQVLLVKSRTVSTCFYPLYQCLQMQFPHVYQVHQCVWILAIFTCIHHSPIFKTAMHLHIHPLFGPQFSRGFSGRWSIPQHINHWLRLCPLPSWWEFQDPTDGGTNLVPYVKGDIFWWYSLKFRP